MTPEDILKARLAKGEIDKETYRELMAEISDQKTSNVSAKTERDGHRHPSGGSDGQITKNDRERAKPGGEDVDNGIWVKVGVPVFLFAGITGCFMFSNYLDEPRRERSMEEARQRVKDAGSISDILNTDRPQQPPELAPQSATTPVSEFADLKNQDIIGCWTASPYTINDGPFTMMMFRTEITYKTDGTASGSSVIDIRGSDDEMF
ncbi:MAG: SHOCT domain-containing protein, partial [Pseudomonadota bacterium]